MEPNYGPFEAAQTAAEQQKLEVRQQYIAPEMGRLVRATGDLPFVEIVLPMALKRGSHRNNGYQ